MEILTPREKKEKIWVKEVFAAPLADIKNEADQANVSRLGEGVQD